MEDPMEDESELSFLNPRSAQNIEKIPSRTPGRLRMEYLWKKFRSLSRTIGRLIKVWKDIKLYGGSRNHYAQTYAWKESFEAEPLFESKNIIMPTSFFRKVWMIVNIFMLLWTASVMPYEICFIDTNTTFWLSIDIIIDLFFLIDILLNFRTAYIDPEGNLVADKSKIVKNYLKTWFAIDLIGVLPFQYLSNIGGYNKFVRFSRMPRLYKILRIIRLFKMVRLLRAQSLFSKLANFFRLTAGLIRMLKFCFTVLLVVHVIGCFWYYLAKLDDFGVQTWVFRYSMIDYSDGDIYLASIYYVTQTIATVGFGDIVPYSSSERIFAILLMGIGVGFYSYTISNLSTIMATLDTRTTNLKKRLAALNEFSKATKLPELIKRKIRTHITHNHQENIYSWFDKDALLKELPASLRRDISIHMHKKIVDKILFFQDKDPQFISYMIPKLRNVHMQCGETLFREGDYAEEIFFLVKGRVNLKLSTGEVFKTYEEGSYFGEVEVLNNRLRQSTIQVASKDAEFLVISKRDFVNVLKEFPKISDEVRETAKVREMNHQEAKVFADNLKKKNLQKGLKRSKTFMKSKKFQNEENEEKKAWSEYSQGIAKNIPPSVHLGINSWEKKANIRYIHNFNSMNKASFNKRNESTASEYSLSHLNPTVSNIIFSPVQFELRKSEKKIKFGEFNVDELNISGSFNDNESFYRDQGNKNIREMLLEINSKENESEKILQNAIQCLNEMDTKQKQICERITKFLDKK